MPLTSNKRAPSRTPNVVALTPPTLHLQRLPTSNAHPLPPLQQMPAHPSNVPPLHMRAPPPTSNTRALHFDPGPAPSNLCWATSNAPMLALPTSNAHTTPPNSSPPFKPPHAATLPLPTSNAK
ncbi:hypothetical protein K438DRAFT_1876645, partial [Mycena galopus ATCC 62051]